MEFYNVFRGFSLDFHWVLWYHVEVKLYFGSLAFLNIFTRIFPFNFYFVFPLYKTKISGKIIFIF